MTVSKYWGDEKQPDAIYAVYLKKVRYVPPAGYEGVPHYRPIDPDSYYLAPELGSDHLQWETIRERIIKAGTLDKLIESLVGVDDKMDSRHFNVFFATYRAFSESKLVADLLFQWFHRIDQDECGSKQAITTQNSIKSIFVCWMDMYPEDFYENDPKFCLLNRLIDFSKSNNYSDLKQKSRKLRERFKQVYGTGGLAAQIPSVDQYTYSLDYDPNDSVYAQERAQMFDISKDNCMQIAEQLTFWDAVLFRELRPYQCQGAIWGHRNKKQSENVYSVRATIDQFNSVSQRVMTSIVLPDCRSEFRARIIEKWIEIAKELKLLRNYSSLKAVLSSLQSEPVFRIKSAWACVSKDSNLLFRELTDVFDANDTNGNERKEALQSQGSGGKGKRGTQIQHCRRTKSDVNLADTQGSVPYLGSFLTDLMMIDQAHSDLTEGGLVNFEKRRREFEVMAKIRLFQSAARSYTVPMDHAFCAWFYYLPSLNENDCFQRSLEVEPPTSMTPEMRRQRNIPTPNGSKVNSLTKMFGHLADEFSNRQPLLNGQFSNDSGINTEESWTSSSTPSSQHHIESSSVALALISRAKILASPGIPNMTIASSSPPSSSWRNGNFGCEFSPYAHFTPQQRPDPELKALSTNMSTASTNCSRCPTPQPNSSIIPPTDLNRCGSLPNAQMNRKMVGHQSTSSHTSSSSSSSVSSSQIKNSTCTSPGSSGSVVYPNGISSSSSKNLNFHLARVGLDDSLQTKAAGANYKCIKIENGDRMTTLVERALDKHLIDIEESQNYCLIQLLPDGGEFRLPDQCNPFYAVAPDPSSPMLNLVLRRRHLSERPIVAPSAKKLNRQKRSNLLRWSSGYL